ncbi:MAG: hypothetical protein JOY80_00805 [Candidatus Dormibacteraeota bacterium]|nr:hypothetical protein [Candidatus Dormibacteraeota bacterium]
MAMHYNGTGWSVVSSADTSSSQINVLYGVACIAVGDCWAVGYADSGASGTAQTLTEHYDSSGWSIVTSANPSTGSAQLNSIACTGDTLCVGVGVANANAALAEGWDGMQWTLQTAPTQGGDSWLYGSSCVLSSCWAVGYDTPTTLQALIGHYDGTSWTALTVSDPPGAGISSYLYGVACADANDCWGVGDSLQSGNPQQTLAVQYDGTIWFHDQSANVTGDNNRLQAVACDSSTDCWAVGYHDASSGVSIDETLIEHYTAQPVTSTPESPWPPR